MTKDLSRDLRLAANLSLQRATERPRARTLAMRRTAWATSGRTGGLTARGRWLPSSSMSGAAPDPLATSARPSATTLSRLHAAACAQCQGWEFALSLRNAFDADIREPSLAPGTSLPNDLPQAGRALDAQVLYRF